MSNNDGLFCVVVGLGFLFVGLGLGAFAQYMETTINWEKDAVKHGAAHWETTPSKNGEPAVVKFIWNDEHKTVEF